ncbi:MAG: hypothetical protein K8J31_20760 [Anaerolineae bacterium]|nr:hypothetical protein [Anaerolineae bacterium]
MNWVLDFDDTLAVGANTWALTRIIPDIASTHHLPLDPVEFTRISLHAQKLSNETSDDLALLDEMFRQLGWPTKFKHELLNRMFQEYVPALYDDTLPFLQRLSVAAHRIILMSNNDHAPTIAAQLDIDHYFAAILTPKRCENAGGKPKRDMWDFAVAQGIVEASVPTQMVGDDPWSEGTLADVCGHSCWIVDRLDRYGALHADLAYQWVSSLFDIPTK